VLAQLTEERSRIDRKIAALRTALGSLDGRFSRPAGGRRRMSAAARREVSQRMRAYWAKRRAKRAKKTD
jgi:hypothetical protein